MNYLAHIYLSSHRDQVIIGNFIADGIKGKQYLNFPIEVQIGILLHREIDTFTDAHRLVRQSTKRFHSKFGHYSGIIVDILYDHFLAKNWKKYSDVELADFVDQFYQLLQKNYTILPLRIRKLMPHMISNNWLLSYAEISGIEKILYQMSFRIKSDVNLSDAIPEILTYYEPFENEFLVFIEELISFSKQKLDDLCTEYLSV